MRGNLEGKCVDYRFKELNPLIGESFPSFSHERLLIFAPKNNKHEQYQEGFYSIKIIIGSKLLDIN